MSAGRAASAEGPRPAGSRPEDRGTPPGKEGFGARRTSQAPLDLRTGGVIGFLSGLVGIGCCVSPVVLYLVGAASATTAVSLGYDLYNNYGWYFRGAGLVLGGSAVYLYLRRRDACDLTGVRVHLRTIATASAVDAHLADLHAVVARAAREVRDLRRTEQRLRRDAAPVVAVAAGLVPLDDRRALAGAEELVEHGEAARARADDDSVEALHPRAEPRRRSATYASGTSAATATTRARRRIASRWRAGSSSTSTARMVPSSGA